MSFIWLFLELCNIVRMKNLVIQLMNFIIFIQRRRRLKYAESAFQRWLRKKWSMSIWQVASNNPTLVFPEPAIVWCNMLNCTNSVIR